MRAGILPGPRAPSLPRIVAGDARRMRRNLAWRRFQLGDVELVDVTPALDVSTALYTPAITPDVIAPVASISDIVQPLPNIPPPDAIVNPPPPSPPVSVSTISDYAGDFLKLAQIAGSTYVASIAARRGVLPPGVTGGISAGPQPGSATRPPGYPSSQADILGSLFGGSNMTTMLLLSGAAVFAVVMLSRKK